MRILIILLFFCTLVAGAELPYCRVTIDKGKSGTEVITGWWNDKHRVMFYESSSNGPFAPYRKDQVIKVVKCKPGKRMPAKLRQGADHWEQVWEKAIADGKWTEE